MPQLPNPDRSSAILIGASSFAAPELIDIPAVRNNLRDLANLLAPPGAFSRDRITVLADPLDPFDVMISVEEIAQRTDDLLLVYYAGHGLVGPDGELYLGVRGTTMTALPYRALAYQHLQRVIKESPARHKLVILDCCYSGRAAQSMSSPAATLLPQADIRGTHVLASSSSTGLSLARAGDPYTAFTGELIRILQEGIRGAGVLISLDDIYVELAHTMRALNYPLPQRRVVNATGVVYLARNRAHESAADATSDPAPMDEPPEATPADAAESEIAWNPDEPSQDDLLRRGFVADVVALRLMETRAGNPHASFCAHVDGPWGSGKSTLLGLVEKRIDSYFGVIRFDAWQQSRMSPPWWSLLTAARAQIADGHRWPGRVALRATELVARLRRTGGSYAVATSILAAAVAVLAYLAWPVAGWANSAKVIPAVIAAIGVLATGSLVISRFLLWDTAKSARLFEQSRDNPMAEVAAHFGWLLARSKKPAIFFIEDLDRCPESYVVELLDTIQTVVKGAASTRRAAYFVIAADGAWLRRSYESTYDSFAECVARPGRSLGHLFLDKFFQLTIPMPALADRTTRAFLDRMLDVAAHEQDAAGSTTPVADATEFPGERTGDGIAERLRAFANGRSQYAVGLLADPAANRRTEHTLSKFAPLLDANPRTIKKFVNTYSLYRSLRTLEGNFVDSNTLALWVVLRIRWPVMADHLEQSPEAVAGIVDRLWASEHFPEPLRDLAKHESLRNVVTFAVGGPLTPALIKQCCGAAEDQL